MKTVRVTVTELVENKFSYEIEVPSALDSGEIGNYVEAHASEMRDSTSERVVGKVEDVDVNWSYVD